MNSLSNFITPESEKVIRNFRYKGGSISYSYNLLWSPLAQYFLKFVPTWWAPNAITLAGLLINLAGCLSLICQSQLGQFVNQWTLLFFSACIFTYQTLDNIDGKQARKTNNSSPLGMLFDHGCDAFGLVFIILSVGRIVCIDDKSTVLYVGFIGALFGFYFSVWCQYHSKGIMILGQINAVDDGIPTVAFMGIFTFFIGQQFWKQSLFQFWDINVTPGICLAYGILLSSILQIWSLLSLSKDNFTKNYIGALKDLIHVLLIVLTLVSIIEYSSIHINNFYCVYFTMGIMFVRNIIYMQLCVTAEMKYNQYQFSTLLFVFGYLLYIFVFSKWEWNQKLYIYAIMGIIVVDFVYFVLKVIFEIREILNIRVFRVNKKKQNKEK